MESNDSIFHCLKNAVHCPAKGFAVRPTQTIRPMAHNAYPKRHMRIRREAKRIIAHTGISLTRHNKTPTIQ
jgi:hypothetical protein